MANKCLNKKFNGVYSGSLKKFGCIYLKGNSGNSSISIRPFSGDTPVVASVFSGNAHFCSSSSYSDNIGTSITINSGTASTNLYVSSSESFTIELKGKDYSSIYNLARINGGSFAIDSEAAKTMIDIRDADDEFVYDQFVVGVNGYLDLTGKSFYGFSNTAIINGSRIFGDITDMVLRSENTQIARGGTPSVPKAGIKYLCDSTEDTIIFDVSKMRSDAPNLRLLVGNAQNPRLSKALWTQNTSRTYFLAIMSWDFGEYLDAMLIDQANKPLNTGYTPGSDDVLNVLGNRTSASDVAVATLKANGITITVNGIEI